MKAGTLVKIVTESLAAVEIDLIDANDEFVAPTPEQDAALALKIEGILKAHGVVVAGSVDKVIKALPLIFSLFE